MILQFPDRKAAAREDARDAILDLRRELEIRSRLPFVGPPGPPNRYGFAKQNYWIDEPTEDGHADHQRGRRYARMTIEAIQEQCDTYGDKFTRVICAIDLEHIIEGMIADGIARYKKGGKGSRTICTSAMSGFLSELSRYIAGFRDGS